MKRIMSALLAVAMLFSLCTFNVFAEDKKISFFVERAGGTADISTNISKDQTIQLTLKWSGNPATDGWAHGAFYIDFDNTKLAVTTSSKTSTNCSIKQLVFNEDAYNEDYEAADEAGDPLPEKADYMEPGSGASRVNLNDSAVANNLGQFTVAMAFDYPTNQDASGKICKVTFKALKNFDATDITVSTARLYTEVGSSTPVEVAYEGSTFHVGVAQQAHTHEMEHHEAKTPTADDNTGNVEYWYCSGCQKAFSDAEGKTEITDYTYSYDFTNYAEDLLAEATTTYIGGTLTVDIPDVSTLERATEDQVGINYNWSAWLMENNKWVKMEKATESDTFTADYVSDNGVYKTYVHCVDDDGVSLIEKYDTVVDNDALTMGNAVITDVKVNGESVRGTVYVDVSSESDIELTVEGENIDAVKISKSAFVDYMTNNGDSFDYTLTDVSAGKFSYVIEALADEHDSATATVVINAYDPAAVSTYASVDVIDAGVTKYGEAVVNLGSVKNANKINYSIFTPYTGETVDQYTTAAKSYSCFLNDNYGYFYARAIVVADTTTDMARKMIRNKRPGGEWTLNAKADGSAATNVEGTVGKAVALEYSATFSGSLGGDTVKYRVIKKAYDGYQALTPWTTSTSYSGFAPAAPGNYELVVLAKAGDGVSYEVNKTFYVHVEGTDFDGDLNVETTGTTAGAPITITATTDATCEVLYRFTASTKFGGEEITSYGFSNTATWVPTKAGTYTITVEALGTNSFGIADAVATTTVFVE